jgi:hypothetical protein
MFTPATIYENWGMRRTKRVAQKFGAGHCHSTREQFASNIL